VTTASDPDLAGVLDKLQQVREIDPSAEQKLLEQLRRTPSKSWPLVAEQFRASLAYHESLAAKPHQTGTKVAASRFESTTPSEPSALQTGYDSADDGKSNQVMTPIAKRDELDNSRPSAPIGTLVDPRRADSDGISSEAMAKSTPYSTPGAIPQATPEASGQPGPFVTHEAVYPISSDPDVASRQTDANPVSGADSAVVPARLEAIDSGDKANNPPRQQGENADWQQLVERAADDLSDRVAATPATTAEVHQHVSLRMLWLLAGDTEKALAPIPHISPAEQDYWSRQIFALATYLDHHSQPDDKRRAAASVNHLDSATTSLRELGALSLRNFMFCKNVYGYGSIETFANDLFSPGQQITLYVEVENYSSKSTEHGYRTSLGSTYEVLDDHGERIAGGEFPDVDDCCRSRRRDFHIQYGLVLPERIEPGRYQLQLIVKDRQSDKIGHATASFDIRGNRTLSSSTTAVSK